MQILQNMNVAQLEDEPNYVKLNNNQKNKILIEEQTRSRELDPEN